MRCICIHAAPPYGAGGHRDQVRGQRKEVSAWQQQARGAEVVVDARMKPRGLVWGFVVEFHHCVCQPFNLTAAGIFVGVQAGLLTVSLCRQAGGGSRCMRTACSGMRHVGCRGEQRAAQRLPLGWVVAPVHLGRCSSGTSDTAPGCCPGRDIVIRKRAEQGFRQLLNGPSSHVEPAWVNAPSERHVPGSLFAWAGRVLAPLWPASWQVPSACPGSSQLHPPAAAAAG